MQPIEDEPIKWLSDDDLKEEDVRYQLKSASDLLLLNSVCPQPAGSSEGGQFTSG